MNNQSVRIGIVGLGYVGLPLFCLFSKKYDCRGLDNDDKYVKTLQSGVDVRNCIIESELSIALHHSKITTDWNLLRECNIYIVAVPTPVNKDKQPDFIHLKEACNALGIILSRNDIVIFESTVYPGTTDEICIPILEKVSGLVVNNDFFVGYSPERINVGDELHRLDNVPKIVSASNQKTLAFVADLYKSVINSEIIRASSIKVAEAAKMYENVQRDVLIALANQYSDYCREEGIDIQEVTDCAATKWNFSNVRPGLIGGHCIGVDAYYLLQRSAQKRVDLPLVITARSVNEKKAKQVSQRIVSYVQSIYIDPRNVKILILGFSYKANTPDIRNTMIATIVKSLSSTFITVDCFDPLVDSHVVESNYGIHMQDPDQLQLDKYDIVIKAVDHHVFDEFANTLPTMVDINLFL